MSNKAMVPFHFLSALYWKKKKKKASHCAVWVIPQLRTEKEGSTHEEEAVGEPEEMSVAIGKLKKESSVCNLKEITKRLGWANRVGSSWLPCKGVGCWGLACGQRKWGTIIKETPLFWLWVISQRSSKITIWERLGEGGPPKIWLIFKPKTV